MDEVKGNRTSWITKYCIEKGNESSDTQICVEGVSDDDNNSVDSDAAYPSDSTQEALAPDDY